MLQKYSRIITRFFVVISCLLAGCSSVGELGTGANNAALPSPQNQPQKVALLLPLQGQYASSAQAIRNGFMAAYYNQKQKNPNAPEVSVLDTSSQDVKSVYSQAISNGATFIVGPLTKNQVQELAGQNNLTVATLALNTLDSQRPPNNMYLFSLSPHDETQQIAARARQDGHERAIIIAPATAWGQTVASSFAASWQQMHGQIADTYLFNKQQELSAGIGNLLHVDKEVVSSQGFKKVQEEGIPFDQLRRQDFDVVFLAASPQQARLIKPLLNFYFAGHVPVYATSTVYSGKPSPQNDRDLNGIMFCDMPWVLDNSSQLPANIGSLQSRVASLWPDSFNNYSKLYAMGIDSYFLISDLNGLRSGSIDGATGDLSLDSSRQVHRKLQWAKIEDGVPVLM